MQRSLTNLALLFTLGAIWGAGPVINKFTISHGVSPLGYSFWQFIGPACILSVIGLYQGKLCWSKVHLQYYFTCGLVGLAIPNTILHLCAPHLPSGIMPVIINTVPIMVYPLALGFRLEKFSWARMLAILIGCLGIMLIIIPKASIPNSNLVWTLLAFISPLCFALTAVFINPNRPQHTSSISLAAGMLLASSIMILPLVIFNHAFYAITMPLQAADYALLARICMHSLGYIIFFTIIKQAGAVYYSLVSGIVILNGIFWGYLIYNESIDIYKFSAIIAILLAISILNYTQGKTKNA